MLTTIALTLVLSCKRPMPVPEPVVHVPHPPVITACEGPDRVTRNLNGVELRRASFACTVVSCEGGDFVRRDTSGAEVDRSDSAFRCMPRPRPEPRPQPQPQNDVLRFGLSVR
jgi:hypothetical protein